MSAPAAPLTAAGWALLLALVTAPLCLGVAAWRRRLRPAALALPLALLGVALALTAAWLLPSFGG